MGLVVVVAERAFVVAAEPSDAPVGNESPIVAEALVHFEFDRLVFALWVLIGVRLAVGLEFAAEQRRRIGVEFAVDRWETRAAQDRAKGIANVGGYELGRVVRAVNASRWETGCFESRRAGGRR